MKIRPIFKTIDIFSFIQFLSRQINYIIKFFLLKVLYLVYYASQGKNALKTAKEVCLMKKAHGTSKQLPALDERSDGILENRGWSAEAKRRFWPKHSWKALMDCYRHSR